MITKHLKTIIIYCAVMSLGIFSACTDDEGEDNMSNAPAKLQFNLTDAPADYDAVLVEIEEVRVHIGEDNEPGDSAEGWMVLDEIQPGIYDLLELQNGMDTVLAEGEVPAGRLSQIRLILGDENSVVVNGVPHDLKTPSAQQSGLKLKVNYDLEPGLYYEFWLDFDASRSVVEKGNGGYNLKPVIRVFTKNTTGSITGYINPAEAKPLIWAYDATDTATSIADSITGHFLIPGLDPGSYTVEVNADTAYADTVITGVNVSQGIVTDLDTLNL